MTGPYLPYRIFETCLPKDDGEVLLGVCPFQNKSRRSLPNNLLIYYDVGFLW